MASILTLMPFVLNPLFSQTFSGDNVGSTQLKMLCTLYSGYCCRSNVDSNLSAL